MRFQFRVFNRKVGITWVRILQVELDSRNVEQVSRPGDAGWLLEGGSADRVSNERSLSRRATKQSCSKSRFFRISAKLNAKGITARTPWHRGVSHGLSEGGPTYGTADFTSNMLGRGFVQKLRNPLSSEIKIFPGTAHLLHLLQQQIKILLPIGEI